MIIELLFILWLNRRIRNAMHDKGRSPGIYQLLLIVLWVLGEVLGWVIGGVFLELGGGAYLFGLLGAGGGAAIALAIANAAEPAPLPETVGEVFD